MRNLHLLSQPDLEALLAEDRAGRGRSLAQLLRLPEAESAVAREAFRSRLLSLALEAYRREKITRRKLREVADLAGFSDLDIDSLFASTDPHEDAVDVLLPGIEC